MSDGDVTLSMSVPLDSDGFLRRECPACERDLKWLPNAADDAESIEAPEGGYFCPYCATQAPPGSWFTQAQIDLAHGIVATEVVGPALNEFTRDINNMAAARGGMLGVSASYEGPDEVDPLTEPNDMRRIDFACHSAEPAKVLDDWDGQVHCLICGRPAA